MQPYEKICNGTTIKKENDEQNARKKVEHSKKINNTSNRDTRFKNARMDEGSCNHRNSTKQTPKVSCIGKRAKENTGLNKPTTNKT